jgi:hypothetical protein
MWWPHCRSEDEWDSDEEDGGPSGHAAARQLPRGNQGRAPAGHGRQPQQQRRQAPGHDAREASADHGRRQQEQRDGSQGDRASEGSESGGRGSTGMQTRSAARQQHSGSGRLAQGGRAREGPAVRPAAGGGRAAAGLPPRPPRHPQAAAAGVWGSRQRAPGCCLSLAQLHPFCLLAVICCSWVCLCRGLLCRRL